MVVDLNAIPFITNHVYEICGVVDDVALVGRGGDDGDVADTRAFFIYYE